MVETPIILGIANTSSIAWSASQRFVDDLAAQLSRDLQHHLYLVVLGPELTPTALEPSPDQAASDLHITYMTASGQKDFTVTVRDEAFPGATLFFDRVNGDLTLSPVAGKPRVVTVAEVLRAIINDGQKKQHWVDAVMKEFFTYEVVYVGKSYGTGGSSAAIDRLTGGHPTVEKELSLIHVSSRNRSLGFITIDQQMRSIEARIKTKRGLADPSLIRSLAGQFAEIMNEPLTKTTVDAAEATLIRALAPRLNKQLRNFPEAGAPKLVRQLTAQGYTHLQVHIDLKDALARVKDPEGLPSSQHSWTFNLGTGRLENPRARR